MRVYLSGGMTGIKEFNFPLFHEVTAVLRAMGWEVDSPAENDIRVLQETLGHDTDITTIPGYAEGDPVLYSKHIGPTANLFCWDFKVITEADAIVLLPHWEKSTGGKCERLVAEMCGKKVLLARYGGVDTGWYFRPDPELRMKTYVL